MIMTVEIQPYSFPDKVLKRVTFLVVPNLIFPTVVHCIIYRNAFTWANDWKDNLNCLLNQNLFEMSEYDVLFQAQNP